MNRICRQYINSTKNLFPIIRKEEKIFFKKLKENIADYTKDNPISSMQELYASFGNPIDVMRNYYSNVNTADLQLEIKNAIRIQKRINIVLAIIITLSLVFTTLLFVDYRHNKENRIDSYEMIIK